MVRNEIAHEAVFHHGQNLAWKTDALRKLFFDFQIDRMWNLLCSSRESALESIASSSRLKEISALTI